MTTVLVFGTFDFVHAGHLHLLKEAKKFGDKLVVSISRDSVVESLKGKPPIHDETERSELVQALSYVDDVVLGDEELGTYSYIQEHKPDIIALGYDQQMLKEDLETKEFPCEIRVIETYKEGRHKSSTIKNALSL